MARRFGSSVVQDTTQERTIDVDLAVVLDETQFPELVHENIDPGPRCANHLRQYLLRYFGKRLLRMARRAMARRAILKRRFPKYRKRYWRRWLAQRGPGSMFS